MFRQRRPHRGPHRTPATLIGLLTLMAVAPPASVAGRDASPEAATATPAEIGIAFEQAGLLQGAEREAILQTLPDRIEEALDAGVSSERRSAALFLLGEIRFALGEYDGARDAFRDAEGADNGGWLSDDATFAAIAALDASGKHEDAAKAWIKLEEKCASGPLLPEIRLARVWNALRRGLVKEASTLLAKPAAGFEWMETDYRVILAQAAIAYHEGRCEDALARLVSADTRPEALYLRALCFEATGSSLKAAAAYQEVAERHPDSGLRDHAMLAKANIFLASGAYRSATEEFQRVAAAASNEGIKAEASLRRAACVFLDGNAPLASSLLQDLTRQHAGTDVGARAQFILGEVLSAEARHEEAIREFNRVLTDYFEHELAARAQYRIGRSLDALGRQHDATGSYEAVVSGYPMAPEAPPAAYLAGVGLLEQGRPLAATSYFQLVLDRYAGNGSGQILEFATPEHRELVEAALCLLELSYHRAGDLGQLSGAPHLMLQRMPPSQSPWRAHALLIDADALASQARYDEARAVLEKLIQEFREPRVGVPANRLLAWIYAQQGQTDLAIEVEQQMLRQYELEGGHEPLSSAYLNKAHLLFNQKQYAEAAEAYEQFIRDFPDDPGSLLAHYQAGLCYLRLDRNGDAVDRWEAIVAKNPSAKIAERVWMRAADLYFRAESYDDARRCYAALLEHFPGSSAAGLSMLRMAHCDYNEGRDAEALDGYSGVIASFPNTSVAREAERGIEMALYRLGQRDDSVEVLAELVDRYPTSSFAAEAQFEIATRLYQEKRFAEAADEFRRVVSQFPGYAAADRAHFLMADAYAESGAGQDARSGYEQFLFLFPDSELRPTVRFRLGSLRFDEGDYMRAAVDFTSVLDSQAEPETQAAARYNLGLCQRMLGETEQARATLESLRADPQTDKTRATEAAYQLGLLHENDGRYELAVAEYELAARTKPPAELTSELHYRIGFCREQLGNPQAAIGAYTKAIASRDKGDPFRLSALVRCAALYEEDRDYAKALSAYRDLSQNADDPELVTAATERAAQLETIAQ